MRCRGRLPLRRRLVERASWPLGCTVGSTRAGPGNDEGPDRCRCGAFGLLRPIGLCDARSEGLKPSTF